MKAVSETEAKRRFNELLKTAQREPVMIRRQNHDLAVILPLEEYPRIHGLNVYEFKQFCGRADEPRAGGLNSKD